MEKRNTKRTRIRAGIEIQGEEGYKQQENTDKPISWS